MSVYKLILKRRSIRKFKQATVSSAILKKLVDAARLAPSGANLQPLEYVVIDESDLCEEVFGVLQWAGYISPDGTPQPGEKPTAYILVLANKNIREDNYQWDVGAAMENMILTALEEGVGSCWIGSINKPKLQKILNIPSNFIITSILALGYPDENPEIEVLKESCKYWKDAQKKIHVPKRELEKIINFNKFPLNKEE